MRLNPEKGATAAERLREIDREEFCGMMIENSDEPYAEEISQEVFNRFRRGQAVETTTQLKEAIEAALSFYSGEGAEGSGEEILRQGVSGSPH